jgi:hypothetical protein
MSCPNCGSEKVRWRSGVHFDNEKICYSCWFTWDPSRTESDLGDFRRRAAEIEAEKNKKRREQEAFTKEWMELSGAGMDARN